MISIMILKQFLVGYMIVVFCLHKGKIGILFYIVLGLWLPNFVDQYIVDAKKIQFHNKDLNNISIFSKKLIIWIMV